MQPRKDTLKRGDVVQLTMESNFPGCFMTVTDPKPWGAQGYICMPQELGKSPALAYYRATWAHMEFVGRAPFIVDDSEICEAPES